jgi:hypothetical protein
VSTRPSVRRTALALSCTALVLLAATTTMAQNAPTVVASGLYNPTSVAIRPETGEVFICDSGAGRIVMLKGNDGAVTPIITGFPRDSYGKGPVFDIGPLGIAFLGKGTLVVGDGGSLDGEEHVRIYALAPPKDSQDPNAINPLTVYDSKWRLGPIVPSPEAGRGEGNFYGVAATAKALYFTANGDDTKGWILAAPLNNGVPGELKPFIATKEKVKVDAPVAITLSPEGKLVVGQMGEVAAPPDSLVCVYNEAGELEIRAELEDIFDICALAYSPKTKKLYGVDFNWPGKEPGALLSIEIKKGAGVEGTAIVKKIMDLDKPTGMAFKADGTLYVTSLGTAAAGSTEKPGKLLKINGDF